MGLPAFSPRNAILDGMRARLRRSKAKGNAATNPYAFLDTVLVDERNQSIQIDAFTRMFVDSWLYCWGTRATGDRKHFAFTSPPGLGKSTLARMMALYCLGQDKNLRIVALSGDVSDAVNTVSLCRGIVLGSAYQSLFPEHRPDIMESTTGRGWKQSEWFLESEGQRKDPTMQAMSSTPKKESVRIDLLLGDDIITERTWDNSEGVNIADAFKKTFIEGRLRLGGVAMYLQNLRGDGDLLHQLRDWEKFVSVWVGVTEDCERMFVKVWNAPEDFPLMADPESYGLSVMECPDHEDTPATFYAEFPLPVRPGYTQVDLEKTDPSAFLTMFRLQGLKPDSLMMPNFARIVKDPRPVWEVIGTGTESGKLSIPDRDRFRLKIVAGLDISGLGRPGTAFSAVAIDSSARRYLLELWSTKDAPENWIPLIDDFHERCGFEQLIVESNGVQDQVRELIKLVARMENLSWKHKVVGTITGSNKWDPHMGLPGLDTKFGSCYTVATMPEWAKFEKQIATLNREVSKKKTPDILMATWFADTGLDKFERAFNPKMSKPIVLKSKRPDYHG